MIRLCAFADEAAADLPGQIAAMKKNGISLLELRSIAGKNVGDFTDEEARDYAETLRTAGIGVWSIGSPLGKVDIGGGGTIAYIPAKYDMDVIDSGVAVLSMHAPWEVTSKADIYEARKGYEAFLLNA